MPSGKKLTEDQKKTIEALYLEYSDERIATVIGVRSKTVSKYRHNNKLHRKGESGRREKRSAQDGGNTAMQSVLSARCGAQH